MVVENIPGTSDKKCPCCGNSWLRHYEKHAGWTMFCQAKGCMNFAEVGAHVRNARKGADKSHRIVAFCKSHNNAADSVDISDATTAPAKACDC